MTFPVRQKWVRITWATVHNPGAIGLLQIYGPGVRELLSDVTGVPEWPLTRLQLVTFSDIDQDLAVLLRDDWAQLMPHGGTQVCQKLAAVLLEAGATVDLNPAARDLYPEAGSDFEADMLATLARAASPRAIDLLLGQPTLWHRWLDLRSPPPAEHLKQSAILDRLVDPPAVVVVGQPNVGKSTLTNALLGRSASIVADLSGTTRDWVAGLAELDGVSVRWMDTPGLRRSDDVLEQQAIELAGPVIAQADVLIAMRDVTTDFPETSALPRRPDLRLTNKVDLDPGFDLGASLGISAKAGRGLDRLEQAVLNLLGLPQLDRTQLWAFSPTLREALKGGDIVRIRDYMNL